MFARVCLGNARALCQFGSSSTRLAQQGMRSPSVVHVPSRPLMVFLSGLDCDAQEDQENAAQFENDVQFMGADPYPHWKKEHLKRKEARVMKANKRVGKAAHGKVAALSALVYLKVRNNWQH